MTTFDDVIETGSAGPGVEYRLVLEGAAFEFCTSILMIGACTETGQVGKHRVAGLMREGLGFEERCYLAGAEIEISIDGVRIQETGYPYLDAATRVFGAVPRVLGAFASSVGETDETATVYDTTDLIDAGDVHVGTETILWIDSGTPTGEILRGQWRTTAQAHNINVGAAAVERPLEDDISIWTKRRCWLYAHTADELGVGSTGRIVWRGVLGAEPELSDDGTVWEIALGSRWELLEQEVAAPDKKRRITGIYYPGRFPFSVNVVRNTDATQGGLEDSGVTINVVGHFENNERFLFGTVAENGVDGLVTKLNADATIAGWGVTFDGAVNDRGEWELYLTTDATPKYIGVGYGSWIDGSAIGDVVSAAALHGDDPTSARVRTVVASTRYLVAWTKAAYPEGVRLVPRADTPIVGPGAVHTPRGTDAEVAAWPLGRLYLDDVSEVEVGDLVVVESTEEDAPPTTATVFARRTDEGYVEAYAETDSGVASIDVPLGAIGGDADLPDIRVAKSYGPTSGTDLAGFRDALVAAAPAGANDASTPWILDDDLADWTDVVAEATLGRPHLARRRYVFYKGSRISDVLKEEAKLLGCFFCLDADFKITLRRLTVETAASTYTIGDGTQIVDRNYGTIRQGIDGLVNVVEVSRGYDPIEDKHTGGVVRVRSIAGIAKAKAPRLLEIKPKAAPIAGDITREDAEALAMPVRAMFGGKIVHVVEEVPISLFDVHVGDAVDLTIEELPLHGERAMHDPGGGMTNEQAKVVARKWNLETGLGTLTCLIVGLDLRGYAPTARVSAASGSGTAWTLALEADRYALPGTQVIDYFAVDDSIRLIEWDAESPVIRYGVIDAIHESAGTLDVTLSVNWTGPGTSVFEMAFDASNACQQTQLDAFSFNANATRRINGPGGSERADVFAP